MNENTVPTRPGLTDRVNAPQYGERFNAVLPATAGVKKTVLDNRQFEGLPGPVSIHLFRPDRTLVEEVGSADVHAVITYANGSIVSTMVCDWDGQFSLICSSLNIEIETYSPTPGGYYADPARVVVFGALVGLGACSARVNFTSEGKTIMPGVVSNFAIPDFARVWRPSFVRIRDDGPEGDSVIPLSFSDLLQVEARFIGGTSARMAAHRLSPSIIQSGLVIPGGAKYVQLRTSGVQLRGNHIFELGL